MAVPRNQSSTVSEDQQPTAVRALTELAGWEPLEVVDLGTRNVEMAAAALEADELGYGDAVVGAAHRVVAAQRRRVDRRPGDLTRRQALGQLRGRGRRSRSRCLGG